MSDFVKCLVDAWEGTISKHLCKLSCDRNLDDDLNLVQRFAVRGIADSETAEAESAVFALICSNIDIAIVVAVK